jgi:hypothetical protein
MAKCPQCGHDVMTPSRLSMFAWRLLACPNCKAGLALVERAPKLFFPVMLVFLALFLNVRIARPNAFLEGAILGGYVVALLAVSLFCLWEVWHPELKIRKRPKPEITLDLGLQNPKNIK